MNQESIPTQGKTRILIADDQTLMRDGLRTILELEEDFEVIGCASDGQEAYEMVRELHPDLVLMDIRMPGMDGVQSTKLIKRDFPKTVVIILTTFDDDEYIIDALNHGASGYLLKDIQGDKLLQALRDGIQGNLMMPSSVAAKLAAKVSRQREQEEHFLQQKTHEPEGLVEELSQREKEIAFLLMKGMSNREIASSLFLSEGTVKNYVSNIYSKLGTRSRTEAVLYLNDLLPDRNIR
ncbi:MAG TPA: response regulator transcription factor [Thermotogota bacterium]|nr:response regulator transcription factor [Thermotogota bacterium]HRW92188.1 response regulator transcription factor [Thermotogota bacterium]